MLKACQNYSMANLQVKNIPESLHRQLRRYARRRRSTLSEVVLEAVKRELAWSAFHERLDKRPLSDLGVSAAALLEEARHERRRHSL
jgi:plasmid stability protein